MNKYYLNNNQVNLLTALSELYIVLMVFDPSNILKPEIFVTTSYITKTDSNPFLSIKNYKVISSIVESNSVYINNRDTLGTIITQIDNMQFINVERKFSEQFMWIKF